MQDVGSAHLRIEAACRAAHFGTDRRKASREQQFQVPRLEIECSLGERDKGVVDPVARILARRPGVGRILQFALEDFEEPVQGLLAHLLFGYREGAPVRRGCIRGNSATERPHVRAARPWCLRAPRTGNSS